MEIDPAVQLEETVGASGGMGFMKDLVGSIPGIDEFLESVERV